MKPVLRLLVLFVGMCGIAAADDAADQRFAGAARSVVTRLIAGFRELPVEGVSRDEAMQRIKNEIAADLEIVQEETYRYPSERARLLAMVHFVTGPQPAAADFKKFFANSLQVQLSEDPGVAELAKQIGDALQGISLGLDMEEGKDKNIGELFARFGPPTTLNSPDIFGIKFNGMEKTVVVLSYDLARKNVWVDTDGAILKTSDMKSWPSKKPTTK